MKQEGSLDTLSRKKVIVGDVYAILLPNGRFAFARVFKGSNIGVYECISNSIEKTPSQEKYMFFVGVYKNVFSKMRFITNKPFENEEQSWPPPQCMVDVITQKGSILYKGEILQCGYDDCKNLEIAAVWDYQHIVDRIMGVKKWYDLLVKPKC